MLLEQQMLRAASVDEKPARTPIDSLGVVTRNRPEAALRCLSGFGAHLRAHGRRLSMVVVDSSDPPQAERLRQSLTALEGLAIRWVGADDKSRFAERLARAAGVE